MSEQDRWLLDHQEPILDGIYKALEKWDREVRSARNLRIALGGKGPTIKRGTKRAAMARYLTDAVLTSIRKWDVAE